MYGRCHRTVIRWKHLSAVFCQPKLCSKQALRRSCTQTDNKLRSNRGNLRFQPWPASCYLKRIWFLMQPNLAPRFPLEMLNGIGNVHFTPINARGFEALVKELAGRSDKRLPLLVFAIAGLFAHHEQSGVDAPFPKDDLRGFTIKVASATLSGSCP